MKKLSIAIGLAACAALAAAVLVWRPHEPDAARGLGADTEARFEASSERLSRELQDSLERSFEKKLAELPNRFQDASDASSRMRSAQRTLDALEDTPENSGTRAALEHEIEQERARMQAAGVAAPPR